MKIKTIDINALEWFDKVNGNSYFSALATINYGMKNANTIKLPFQYGYGDHYKQMAFDALEKENIISRDYKNQALWNYCIEHNIILRCNIRPALKREVLNFVK